MAVKMTVTCDRCNNEIDTTKDQGFTVKILVDKRGRQYGYAPSPKKEADWCRACVVACRLHPPMEDEPKPEAEPSLEDIIRDICRDEIAQAQP